MGVELEGIAEALAKLQDLKRQLAGGSDAGHRELANQCAAQIRATAPVDSGDIRSSVRVVRENPFRTDVIVGYDGITEYLGHQEFGTRHQPARPFVRPAAGRAEAVYGSTMLSHARRRIG